MTLQRVESWGKWAGLSGFPLFFALPFHLVGSHTIAEDIL